MKRFCLCLFVLTGYLSTSGAHAQTFVLDTGTPASATSVVLSNSEWFAAEFYATAGETVTELSAYLAPATGNGDNFAFDIYADAGGSFLTTRQTGSLLDFTATGSVLAPGWNTTTVDWVVPATGDYWLAIEGDSTATHNKPTFDAQEETSAGTGTVPALAFASSSGGQFTTSGAVPVGLEVTAAGVPEPAGWCFLVAGVIMVACLRGGRRAAVH